MCALPCVCVTSSYLTRQNFTINEYVQPDDLPADANAAVNEMATRMILSFLASVSLVYIVYKGVTRERPSKPRCAPSRVSPRVLSVDLTRKLAPTRIPTRTPSPNPKPKPKSKPNLNPDVQPRLHDSSGMSFPRRPPPVTTGGSSTSFAADSGEGGRGQGLGGTGGGAPKLNRWGDQV